MTRTPSKKEGAGVLPTSSLNPKRAILQSDQAFRKSEWSGVLLVPFLNPKRRVQFFRVIRLSE